MKRYPALEKRSAEKKALTSLGRKNPPITLRLSAPLEEYIEALSKALTDKSENKVTKTWVMTKLMELGTKPFEERFGIKRKK